MSGWGFDDLGTGSDTVHELGGLETGHEPISDVGTEPLLSHSFEDFLNSSFDNLNRVADVVSDEAPQTLSEPIQPQTVPQTQPEEGMRKKRVKTTARRTDLALVRKFLAIQYKPSDSPSRPKQSTTKPSAKPIRKSF